jgi:hypothetical protein
MYFSFFETDRWSFFRNFNFQNEEGMSGYNENLYKDREKDVVKVLSSGGRLSNAWESAPK